MPKTKPNLSEFESRCRRSVEKIDNAQAADLILQIMSVDCTSIMFDADKGIYVKLGTGTQKPEKAIQKPIQRRKDKEHGRAFPGNDI